MSQQTRIIVAKRDGGLEPFQAAKPRRVMAAALQACRRERRIADALVRAIELHLLRSGRQHTTTSDYIFRCIHTALSDTGLGDVAQRLARHRHQRQQRREGVSVVAGPGRPPVRWQKRCVVETLQQCYGITCGAARIVAGEVERRVLSLGYSVVSTRLIRELIESELSAWGLSWPATDESIEPAAGRMHRGDD